MGLTRLKNGRSFLTPKSKCNCDALNKCTLVINSDRMIIAINTKCLGMRSEILGLYFSAMVHLK